MKGRLLYMFIGSLAIAASSCAISKSKNTALMRTEDGAGTDTFFLTLFAQYPQYFDTLLTHNDTWGIQIVYTQIDRNWLNKPGFTHHYFNTANQRYFYPASTVKLPIAALALQKLNALKVPRLDKYCTMITVKGDSMQTAVYNDPTSEDGRPSVAQYIKKIFLVSDNDAFNRLYEFLGQEYINNQLHELGWDSVQILHRLNMPNLPEAENRLTNPVAFYDTAATLLYQQTAVKSQLVYQPRHTFLGEAHYDGDSLINEPFDFSKKNRLPLPDLHNMLLRLMFPKAIPKKYRFNLTKDDYKFLHQYMSMLPRQSRFPQYDSTYNDAYGKFLFYGAHDPVDSNIRIYNKIGDAYGFLTDAAYIIDTKNRVEFMLSATILCDSTGIYNYNDETSGYETVGFPF
jgi:hypothetical protein